MASERPVLIVMGSASDLEAMRAAVDVLDDFGVGYDVRVLSAHRTPDRVHELARQAADRDFRVVIAGAGRAAHLAGVLASSCTLPVIGVPLESGALRGVDALYATVQMPGGVPVATMGIGSAGARNAALFAVQILALGNAGLRQQWQAYRETMQRKVDEQDRRVREELGL